MKVNAVRSRRRSDERIEPQKAAEFQNRGEKSTYFRNELRWRITRDTVALWYFATTAENVEQREAVFEKVTSWKFK